MTNTEMGTDYFNTKGEKIEEVNPLVEYKIVAKIVKTETLTRYFIKRANGRLLDPRKLNDRQLKNSRSAFIQVDETVFKKYYDYLTMKTATPLTSIERML